MDPRLCLLPGGLCRAVSQRKVGPSGHHDSLEDEVLYISEWKRAMEAHCLGSSALLRLSPVCTGSWRTWASAPSLVSQEVRFREALVRDDKVVKAWLLRGWDLVIS